MGWWPGDARYPKAAFYAFAHPAPPGFADGQISPASARFDPALGEYVLDWARLGESDDPRGDALDFAHSAFRFACEVCGWDAALESSARGVPPPVS